MLKGLYPIETFEHVKYENVFSDVTNFHWAWKPIQVLQTYKVIDVFEDGIFCPNEEVTVAQAISMCIKMTRYNEYVEKNTVPWYKGVIETANKYKLTEGLTFEPEAYITREQMAKLVYNTVNIPLVLVTGWTANGNGGEPIVTTEIADKNSHMGYKSLLTEYYSTILFPATVTDYLGEKEVVLEALGVKKENYEIEGNPEKNYRVNKIYEYHGRPVTMRLFFWKDKLFMIAYEFGNRLTETGQFGIEALNQSISLYGKPDNKTEIDELFKEVGKNGESADFIAIWSDMNAEFMKDEEFTNSAEELEKKIEFVVRASKKEVDTSYGIEDPKPPKKVGGLVQIGLRFADK